MMTFLPEIPALCAEKTIMEMSGVCWDDKVEGGHNCDGSCEYGFGWYVSPSAIKLDTEADEPFEFDEIEFNKLVFGGV